jgi:hypothetical protein
MPGKNPVRTQSAGHLVPLRPVGLLLQRVTLDRNVERPSLNTKQAVKHSLEIQDATAKNILICRCLHGR